MLETVVRAVMPEKVIRDDVLRKVSPSVMLKEVLCDDVWWCCGRMECGRFWW